MQRVIVCNQLLLQKPETLNSKLFNLYSATASGSYTL
jgi:hypothetical protein